MKLYRFHFYDCDPSTVRTFFNNEEEIREARMYKNFEDVSSEALNNSGSTVEVPSPKGEEWAKEMLKRAQENIAAPSYLETVTCDTVI